MNFEQRFDDEQLQEFLAEIFERTGYDYRNYSVNSMRRRFTRILDSENLKSLNMLRARFVESPSFRLRLIESLSVPTTSMFRDPQVFKTIREKILPILAEQPVLRVWCAGCSTGEEPYSVAIMLMEEGLYDRSRIYATDISESFLSRAREGVFSVRMMQDYTANYLASGGSEDFSSYYVSGYDRVVFNPDVKRNIVFAQHNLESDSSFNEFSLIFCRNVLIYFNAELQKRVHALLEASLSADGFLVLGEKESLPGGVTRSAYQQVVRPYKIFRRRFASSI